MATKFVLALHDTEVPHPIPGGAPILSRVVTHLSHELGVTPIDSNLRRLFGFDPAESRGRNAVTTYAGAKLSDVAQAKRFAVYECVISKSEWLEVTDQLEALGVEDTNNWAFEAFDKF